MLFAIFLTDAANSGASRSTHHADHVAHFGKHKSNIAVAGPLADANGNSVGSLVIYDAPSEQKVRNFIEGDPFFGEKVWESVSITCFNPSIYDAEKFRA